MLPEQPENQGANPWSVLAGSLYIIANGVASAAENYFRVAHQARWCTICGRHVPELRNTDMKHIGLARMGRDAELKKTAGGESYCNLSLAVDYRDGKNRETQWVSATLWGKGAEVLAEYLVKGSVHCFTLSDMHVKMSDGKAYLNARCESVELGPKQGGAPKPQDKASTAPEDDDIPF